MNNALLSELQNHAEELQSAPPVHSFTLKQTGARPFEFSGTEICSAMSFVPGPPLWYEINVYQTTNRTFVVGVRMFTKSENESDVHRVMEAMSLEDVVGQLESYDPSFDIDASSLRIDDHSVSIAELSLAAITLRQRLEEARRQFKNLVGDILYELEND